MLEKISNLEGEPQKANFMNKDDYFNFLLKYVITPDSEIDTKGTSEPSDCSRSPPSTSERTSC